MLLIKPSFEILEQKNLLEHIERCGRTAYRSEDKICSGSAEKFVEMLIKRGHGAVLEHGTVYLKIPQDRLMVCYRYLVSKYSEKDYYIYEGDKYLIVTTNYRILVENNWLDDLQYQCEPTEFHEKRLSVRFICDRGVSHEFVRHRVFSFVQESTRYCNYSKDKFGTECTFIIPSWLDLEEGSYNYVNISETDLNTSQYLASLKVCENSYLQLLEKGWTPQQARSVLPNSLKTELIMTGTIEQWKGFFKLRCAPDAHPQARELAIPLQESFKFLEYL